jgi:aldose 1-epimerase
VLSVNALEYLPTNEIGVPLGEFRSVIDTGFDFLSPKVIGQDFLLDEDQKTTSGYDHSFILNSDCLAGECAATVTSPDSLLTMKVFTTKPAVQLYTGNFVAGNPNRSGGEYAKYAGLALETQYLPDSPNHPEWPQPSPILNPNDEYFHSTVYQFLVNQ